MRSEKMKTQGPQRQTGFTLVEVMIVVGIIAILAGIAWPSFERQIVANKRKDAIKALTAASNDMEKCRTDNGSYTNCGAVFQTTSPEGRYTVSATITGGGDGYSLSATNNTANYDTACTTLTLNNLGQKGAKDSGGTAVSVQAAHSCWGD
jgi:type IV pilus assembly protein PilE